MSGRVERALVDLVGGPEGGVTLWEIACGRLERIAREHREEYAFRSHPAGALRRLAVALDDAHRVAALAVELQTVLDADPLTIEDRAGDLVDVLLARARALALERQGLAEGMRRLG